MKRILLTLLLLLITNSIMALPRRPRLLEQRPSEIGAALLSDRPVFSNLSGFVVSVHRSASVCYLNVVRSGQESFAIVIFAKDYHNFPLEFQNFYLHQNIKVAGPAKRYKGRLQAIVHGIEQIQVMSSRHWDDPTSPLR